jgi:23S rRNA (cytidine1920-2'-O)/16S rRNA (cytidine1409-2'-O)-methyltransferase
VSAPSPYVSRAGLKLRHALDVFAIDPCGLVCADLGSSTGGFTDCLIQAGAARVYAVDTAYGQLAWKLRRDTRVVVMERTNALHSTPPEPVDLVVIDLGWTPQRLGVPAARKWVRPDGRIISLVKPHYEAEDTGGKPPPGGVLSEADAATVLGRVLENLPALGVQVLGHTQSPIRGGTRGRGNVEYLVLLAPSTTGSGAA